MSNGEGGLEAGAISVHASMDSLSGLNGRLTREWGDLARRVGAEPFLFPGWMTAWWRAFGAGELELLAIRRSGRLVGILPVAHCKGRTSTLTNYHTPQSGILAEDDSVAFRIAQLLFASGSRRVCFGGLLAGDASMRACSCAAAEAGYTMWVHPFQSSPYLSIDGSWRDYQGHLGKTGSSSLGRNRRRLGREGSVRFDIVGGGDELDGALHAALVIESLGWKSERGTSILSRPDTTQFYTEIARWAAARGSLRLFMLSLNGSPIATVLALEEHRVCHMLKIGYDPRYRRVSPGLVLIGYVLEHCFDRGLTRVEFLGDADPYKMHWTDQVHDMKRFDAFAPSVSGRVALAVNVHGRNAVKSLLRSRDQRHNSS